MNRHIPQVSKYMSPTPHTIGREQTLSTAHHLMREHRIRHLPVLAGGHLVGLLSERDLSLIESIETVDPETTLVDEAMTQVPYTVGPEAPLDEVVATMAAQRYGSAVVVDGPKVVGVFTTIDALNALLDILRSRATR